MIKDFFKLYGFLLLVIFGFLLCLATTIGVPIATIILCVIFKTGIWCLLLIALLFTLPFWVSVYAVLEDL